MNYIVLQAPSNDMLVSVQKHESFFAWLQVPTLHKSELEELPPKASQKPTCSFPSIAAGSIFKEKEEKRKRIHQRKKGREGT